MIEILYIERQGDQEIELYKNMGSVPYSYLFLRGFIIGFSIAAPVGPIGVLCIRRTLAEGRGYGLISGLGAATADSLYGCIAGFSLTFISNLLVSYQLWLRIIGGISLCYLGLKTFLATPSTSPSPVRKGGLIGAYISTLLLTLTNPMTILAFVAIFAALGIGSTAGSYISSATLVLGVFIGSALWWLILSSGVSVLGRKFNPTALRWLNRISGTIITIFGVIALITLKR